MEEEEVRRRKLSSEVPQHTHNQYMSLFPWKKFELKQEMR
jgi:hypothetical protein